MPWPFSKNTQRYALVADRSRSLLASQGTSPTGTSTATPLGWADCPLSEAKSVHQLMANLTNPKGDVAISLPLDQFEVLTLAVNKVPREVVPKILPYHIAKVFDEPLTDFIYDWQIAKELKDSLQLNVFLFPAKMFQDLRTNLGHYKLNPTTLEPDVFSACAYLESRRLLQSDQASLIALLWPKSISIAIYDKDNLVLTRTVQIKRPEPSTPQEDRQEEPREEISLDEDMLQEPGEIPAADSLFEPNPDDLLANFLIETKKEDGDDVTAGAPFGDQADESIFHSLPDSSQAQAGGQSWPGYINQVSLELMRTRDYFNSVVKGNQVKTLFVGGGENSWQPLASELENSLGINVKHLMDPDSVTIGDALLEAISIGVLS